MKKEDLIEYIELLESVEEVKPLIAPLVETVKSFSSELAPLLDGISDYMVDKKIANIKRFEADGFTREEALLLTMDMQTSILKSLRSMSSNQKK